MNTLKLKISSLISHHSSLQFKQRFTLIELLVVVGIIAVLAGLIIPATGMARTSAKRAACISNQGQVAKLVQQGMRKNDEFLVSGTNLYQTGNAWDRFLFDKNILLDLKVARCPSIVYTQSATLSGASDSSSAASDVSRRLQEAYGMVYTEVANGTSYGFDMRGTRYYQSYYDSITDTTRKTTGPEFQIAPNQLIFGGCSASLIDDQIVARALLKLDKDKDDTTHLEIGRPVMVHGDQCNFFFADGHAESLTKENVLTKFFPSRTGTATAPVDEALYVAKTHHAETGSNSWWFDPDAD